MRERTKKSDVLPVALIFHSGEISSPPVGIIPDKKRASKSTNLSFLRLEGRWVVNVRVRRGTGCRNGRNPFWRVLWTWSSFPRACSWERISADVRDHTVELSVFWRVIGLSAEYSSPLCLHLSHHPLPFGRIGSRERASARIRLCRRPLLPFFARSRPSSAVRAKGISFGIHVPADCGNESTRSRFPVHRVQRRSSTTRFLSYLALSLPPFLRLFPFVCRWIRVRSHRALAGNSLF